ncbi:MAG: endonuclease/exonuclease/phosphatase family protein [Prevotella sp.]|jgi:endonuclease/exonuclease/phosphatase (EEP) superfamily protein YafD
MIRHLKSVTLRTIAAVNIFAIVLMLLSGYAGNLNPEAHPTLSCFSLFFPGFLLLNLAFLVFWVFFKMRYVLIPFLGFVVAFVPVRTYTPLNITHSIENADMKVLSYNTWGFGGFAHLTTDNPVLQYIKQQDADIVCLQEGTTDDRGLQAIDSLFSQVYLYRDSARYGRGGGISILSKYPIIRKIHITFEQPTNNVACAWLLKREKDTLLLVNCHLQSIGLTEVEKEGFKQMVKGDLSGDKTRKESKRLLSRLGSANAQRAGQVRAVAALLRKFRDKSTILCGDFNSSPLSYAHRQIEKRLNDCYTIAGNGPGISYHLNGFYVRIDNIFCSDDWQPLKCVVDKSISASDHYPIVCWLKKKPNH